MFSAHIEKHEEEVEHEKNEERLLEEDFGDTLLGALRSYFWDMLEYPETSPAAQAMATISMMFVVMSTVTFLLESNLEQENDILFAREGMNTTTTAFNATSFSDKERKIVLTITQIIDNLAITFFTAEYFARLILSPNKRKFVFNKMNMVDLLAIVPFYLALVLEGLEDMEIIGKAGKIVRLVRFVQTSTRYCVLMLYFINTHLCFQDHANSSDFQDGPSLCRAPEPGVHPPPGVQGPWPDFDHHQRHRSHVLQPRVRLRARQ